MTHIIYISYDGMTDPLGQSQVLPYLRGLAKKGYKFHLISFEKADRYEQNRTFIENMCSEAGVDWHPMTYTKKPPLLSTMYDVNRMWRKAKSLAKNHPIKLVHCRSYIAALIGLRLKHNFGIKFLFDMRGFWADERIDGKIWSRSNPIFNKVYQFFKKKELDFLKEADYTISLTENAKDEILSWKEFQTNPIPIQVIPTCVDLELFNPEKITTQEKIQLRKKLNVQDEAYILGYVGSIGTWYMLPEMLDFFITLKSKIPTAVFLLVTADDHSAIMNQCLEKGISKEDVFLTKCNHKDVPLHLALFDSSVFFIRPTYSKKASSPTKQGEIMAMGIPLTCNYGVGDTDLLIEKYKAGSVVHAFVKENYLKAINYENFDRESSMNGAQSYFGLKNGVEKYAQVYLDILKK